MQINANAVKNKLIKYFFVQNISSPNRRRNDEAGGRLNRVSKEKKKMMGKLEPGGFGIMTKLGSYKIHRTQAVLPEVPNFNLPATFL